MNPGGNCPGGNAAFRAINWSARELEYLKMAVDTVRLDAIRERCMQSVNQSETVQNGCNKYFRLAFRNMYKIRSAHRCHFNPVVLGVSLFINIVRLISNRSINKQFTDYELSTTRGEDTQNADGRMLTKTKNGMK